LLNQINYYGISKLLGTNDSSIDNDKLDIYIINNNNLSDLTKIENVWCIPKDLSTSKTTTSENDFITKSKCDQVLDKKYFNICYSYEYKGLLAGWAKLDGNLVDKENIKKRPSFFEDKDIPKEYRSKSSDYTGTGDDWNRGHAIIADADIDYDDNAVKSCYVMSQIMPQSANVNQHTWLKVEEYGRNIAKKLGYLNSVTVVKYQKSNFETIKNNVVIPSGYYRIYYNNDTIFKKCFYYKNDLNINWKDDILKNHEVDCLSINR
jgi:endonuclease G